MYKILVLSDTHGNLSNAITVIERIKDLNCIFHLGDMVGDAEDLQAIFDIPVEYVAGNCDFYDIITPKKKIVELLGKKFYLTHGHMDGVKYSLNNLREISRQNSYDGIFFGHTHISEMVYEGDTLIVNPGSISQPRDGKKPGYALIQIDDKGRIHGSLGNL